MKKLSSLVGVALVMFLLTAPPTKPRSRSLPESRRALPASFMVARFFVIVKQTAPPDGIFGRFTPQLRRA